MKKIFLPILFLILLASIGIAANPLFFTVAELLDSDTATDYTADENCQGAWYMNADGTNESDRSGNGETLIRSGATSSSTVPSGYSGASLSFDGNDYLYHNDGGSTDISGADQNFSACAWFKPNDNANDMLILAKWIVSPATRVSLVFVNGKQLTSLKVQLSGYTNIHCHSRLI